MDDYWSWKSFFSIEEVKILNNYINENFDIIEDPSQSATDLAGNFKKNTKVKEIKLQKLIHFDSIKRMISSVYATNKNNYGYILFEPNAFDKFLHSTYSSKNLGKYDYHTDESRNNFVDTKFTVIANLSTEKYVGGDFYIFNTNEKKVDELSNPGDVIMFKSYLNHKVTPVIKGTRQSLSYFISGPKFR